MNIFAWKKSSNSLDSFFNSDKKSEWENDWDNNQEINQEIDQENDIKNKSDESDWSSSD